MHIINRNSLLVCTLAALACFAVRQSPALAQGRTEGLPAGQLLAQAAPASGIDKIRAQAQRMKEYRDVLADRDPNVRLAALDQMLKSDDDVLREMAYDAAFASADSTLRALALRSKIMSMKTLVVEIENTAKLPEAEWTKLMSAFKGPKLVFNLANADPQTGNLRANNSPAVVSGSELSLTIPRGALRLRLGDGGVMTGTVTYRNETVAARLALQ